MWKAVGGTHEGLLAMWVRLPGDVSALLWDPLEFIRADPAAGQPSRVLVGAALPPKNGGPGPLGIARYHGL